MGADMSTEKFYRILTYLKEAKSIAAAMTTPPGARPNTQKLHLLRLLDRAQHLVVSLRADFIDLFYFKSPYEQDAPALFDGAAPEMPPEQTLSERESKVVPFDRRRARADRRKLRTFLARDRRSGLADRRRRGQCRAASTHASPARP